MEVVIKLKPVATNPFDGSRAPTAEEEREALRAVALEVQQFNVALASILTNGPIRCSPDSESYEGYLGDCNTRPNEFGYVRVVISNYDSLDWPDAIDWQQLSFTITSGEPVRGDGVRVGEIQ